MAEREHFTNGRVWAFGTGFGLVSLAFGAQIGGWHHWVTIGGGYGMGTLLMLGATVLIAKSYFSRHPELPAGRNALHPPELVLPEASPLKQAKPTTSASEVREQSLAIVGDLCGFLRRTGHPVEAQPLTPYDRLGGHEDGRFGGLGDRKSDSTIRDQFPALFETRISQAKKLIGDLGVLDTKTGFTSVGDVLSMPGDVWNAGDVREIIDALEASASAISEKYLHGVGFQFATPPISPPTAREIQLFTPLQLEAFGMAKEMRDWLRSIPPRLSADIAIPADGNADGTAAYLVAYAEAQTNPWDEKFGHDYAGKFSDRLTALTHKIGATGMNVSELEQHCKWAGSEENILHAIQVLKRLGSEMEQP